MTTPTLHFNFGQPLHFANPTEIITARTLAEVRPALCAVQAAADAGHWAAGYVAYEAAPAFDPALCVHSDPYELPLLWFGIFDAPQEGGCLPMGALPPGEWQPESSRTDYDRAITAIREAIAAGDVYQVNHTFRLHAGVRAEPDVHLRTACMASLELGRFQIRSASPELFFQQQGRQITTRPMKGTRPRGRWAEEDQLTAAELAASEKDRAENVMIVDLLRNDLGRIAVPGSVHVSKLFEIEHYPTVYQMTSTIKAELRPEITLEDTFAALFPCGSVTGAPKISAMQKISVLEHSPRQVYCGAVGYVSPREEAVFRVAIRTALTDTQAGRRQYGVGSGIVWDSTAEVEYEEALSKAAVLAQSAPEFELLETLRWEAGEYALLGRHLDRLIASAAYFDFGVDRALVETALSKAAAEWGTDARRVRLRVSQTGKIALESGPVPVLTMEPSAVVLAQTPVSRFDPFLCHKTTHRTVYDQHRAAAPPDVFDVLLWNEDGELTEFTLGNLVVELNDMLWTPPRTCGLLNGTLRGELLAAGRLQERVLRCEDLAGMPRVWLINSVRGFVPVFFASVSVVPISAKTDV